MDIDNSTLLANRGDELLAKAMILTVLQTVSQSLPLRKNLASASRDGQSRNFAGYPADRSPPSDFVGLLNQSDRQIKSN
jgi:hypothetical protein